MQYVAPQQVYDLLSSPTFSAFSIIATIICGAAVISSYAFPQQRKFPNIALVWTCIMDLVLSLYMAVKWTNGPLKQSINANIAPGSAACRISIYTLLVMEIASAATGATVAFTLHATIVKNIDFEQFERKYHKKFVVSIWAISLIVPLLSFADAFVKNESPVCSLTSAFGYIMMLVPWLIIFAVQLWYIILVTWYIIKTTCSVKTLGGATASAYTHAQLWLYSRFIGMLFNQLILWLNVNIWNIRNAQRLPITRAQLTVISLIPFFLGMNGLIVLVGNRSLKKLIAKKIQKLIYTWKHRNAPAAEIVLSDSGSPRETDFL